MAWQYFNQSTTAKGKERKKKTQLAQPSIDRSNLRTMPPFSLYPLVHAMHDAAEQRSRAEPTAVQRKASPRSHHHSDLPPLRQPPPHATHSHTSLHYITTFKATYLSNFRLSVRVLLNNFLNLCFFILSLRCLLTLMAYSFLCLQLRFLNLSSCGERLIVVMLLLLRSSMLRCAWDSSVIWVLGW
jgi:hypothetical protein